jgi:predicted nucleic acid-binding protein
MPGKNNKPLIIVDADAIISFVVTDEVNHVRAKAIMQNLSISQGTLLFPTTAICEAVTVLRGRLNKPDAASRIVQQFQSGAFSIQAVNQEILSDAAELFNPLASKKNTLFDAVIAAIAKKLHADAIFSFDGWYRKIGLLLADDLISKTS